MWSLVSSNTTLLDKVINNRLDSATRHTLKRSRMAEEDEEAAAGMDEEEEDENDVPESFDESAARQILQEQRQGVIWSGKETAILERLHEYEKRKEGARHGGGGGDASGGGSDGEEQQEPLAKMTEMQRTLDASKRTLREVRSAGGGFNDTEARILSEMSQLQERWEEQKVRMLADLSQQMQSWDRKGTQLREDLMTQLQHGIDERHERQSQMKERFDRKRSASS